MIDHKQSFENFNSLIEQVSVPEISSEVPKMIFICGTPRSGTTLLCQILTAFGHVGYIDNLIARFAAVPEVGIRLSQSLNLPKNFTGNSSFGATELLTEPHEFGFGWSTILGGTGLIQPDTEALSLESIKKIKKIGQYFGAPTVFKSFSYLWHIPALAEALPDAYWVRLKRDQADTAQSLEYLYQARNWDKNDDDVWHSAVCQKTMHRDGISNLKGRCFAQIEDLDEHLETRFADIPVDRKVEVQFEELVDNPQKIATAIFQMCAIPFSREKLETLKL